MKADRGKSAIKVYIVTSARSESDVSGGALIVGEAWRSVVGRKI
jgi:hypothetical protein